MDDSDPMVVEHAKNKLLEYGVEIIPDLEVMEEDCFSRPSQIENVSEVLSCLRFHRVENALQDWLASDDKSLMQAVYTICTYQFPDLKIEEFTSKFRDLRHQCWMRSEEHTSELQSRPHLVCRLLLEKKKKKKITITKKKQI